MDGPVSIADKLAELSARIDALTVAHEAVTAERDDYRKLYLQTLELCRKLELGIVGPKSERLSPGDAQLTMSLLQMLVGEGTGGTTAAPVQPAPAADTQVATQRRTKPTGRKPLPEKLPRVDIEVLPPEVQHKGIDAFTRIGEEVTETIERRPASLVVVRTHKPKFVRKGREQIGRAHV